MQGSILVLKGQSLYNVLRMAADSMAEAFHDMDYEVTVLDLTIDKEVEAFNWNLVENFDLVFSFQALLFDYCPQDGKSAMFASFKDTKFFGHIMDHPIYHSTRVASNHEINMYVGCMDKGHVDYIERYYPGVKNVMFIPHGGFTPNRMVPYKERTIEVFFPGSYKKPSAVIDKIDNLPEVYRNLSYKLIDEMKAHPLLALQDVLLQYLEEVNFAFSSEEFSQIMLAVAVVDEYIHEDSRDYCIRGLLNNGIRLSVCGSGWDELDINLKDKIQILNDGGMDFTEVLECMGNSKMVLNHIPTLQQGMHERMFSSMLSGAISLTNDFPIIHEEFIDGENIILYNEETIFELSERIKELIANPDKAEEIANNGYKIAKNSHTWAKNAETILRITGIQK